MTYTPRCGELPRRRLGASLREAAQAGPVRLVAHPDVPADLTTLAAYGPDVVDAARVALDDLAHGRIPARHSANGTSAAT